MEVSCTRSELAGGSVLCRLRVPGDLEGPIRVDRFLSDRLEGVTRSQLGQRMGHLTVNGVKCKLSKSVYPGDAIELLIHPPPTPSLEPEPTDLDILFESDQVLVVNKSQGMVVHPAPGNLSGTLVNAIMHKLNQDEEWGESGATLRPGIVHRLDKDTSGVIIAAKNPAAQEELASQFRERRVSKHYLCLVVGCPANYEGKVDNYIFRDPVNRKRFTYRPQAGRGKHSISDYRIEEEYPHCTLLSFYPCTGRTHQIRVHALSLGSPIVGDPVYGRSDPVGLMLHAYSLSLTLPGEDSERCFRAPLPERFLDYATENGARESTPLLRHFSGAEG